MKTLENGEKKVNYPWQYGRSWYREQTGNQGDVPNTVDCWCHDQDGGPRFDSVPGTSELA